MRSILLSLASLALVAIARAEPFEIKDGDRVLFLGDTLLEREGTYGYLETRMVEHFPDRKFTVRNLAFSADTPLGWSRASFDPAAKGFERLKEQLALVKPTVVFLGYGMAASLQEMTDRSQDWTLNRDPARYGTEPMSAARFKKELAQCMDAIIATTENTESTEGKKDAPASPALPSVSSVPSVVKKSPVRFVLLSPIRHEDLRQSRPGTPDPTEHNKLLKQYSTALMDLAKERDARFVSLSIFWASGSAVRLEHVGRDFEFFALSPFTENGIHPTPSGYMSITTLISQQLGWSPRPKLQDDQKFAVEKPKSETLRAAIIRKNELFFHRWRPANETYLFGFRKHEQGQNAKEMPMFDPLIAKAEDEIERLKKSSTQSPRAPVTSHQSPVTSDSTPAPASTLPHPQFTLADGLEISLWAENPLLAKPTQCNWDAQGRLWVGSSALYPQIAPGQVADDKIIVLEDTNGDGKAEKSTVFVDGLLIPTGVAPVLTPEGHWACYVGQSTELLYFEDTDGDGKADKKRIVFSGFGTEDTHHIVHTLRWAPDGRLNFSQSVYIHTHMETPWGVVRLNSGGVFAYDPRTERVEVVAKGLWNTWGHAWDKWGQSFLTDGAGRDGISWAFPGATFAPSEGARRTMPSVTPGNYPKFCGLELIYSPHFPADWQGTAVTNDFRAHKVVHFKINDLGAGGKSGYIAEQLPVLVQTSDATFRPIDVKLGPDGAIYIADWSNPIINHGEVDFRDPRRDHEHGRIWRLSMKGGAAVKWESLVGKKPEQLAPKMLSENLWEREQSSATLLADRSGETLPLAETLFHPMESGGKDRLSPAGSDASSAEPADFAILRLYEAGRVVWGIAKAETLARAGEDPGFRSAAARYIGKNLIFLHAVREKLEAPTVLSESERRLMPWVRGSLAVALNPFATLERLAKDNSPRVRIEAVRTLARIPNIQSASLILDAAINAPKDDPFYDFAAWLSINDLAEVWTKAVLAGEWKPDGREKQLEFALNALDASHAGPVLAFLLRERPLARDGSGPWIELIGSGGGRAEVQMLAARVADGGFDQAALVRAMNALAEAARIRDLRPDAPSPRVAELIDSPEAATRAAAARLAGLWKLTDAAPRLETLAAAPAADLRAAAFDGLRTLGGPAVPALQRLVKSTNPAVPPTALAALAQVKPDAAVAAIPAVLGAIKSEQELMQTWRGILQSGGAINQLAKKFPADVPKPVLVTALRAARELGKKGQPLAKKLAPLAGEVATSAAPANYTDLAARAKADGDPVAGEALYRRTASACTTCHAIGGAGGKLGPDMTSIGASAPPDYIIESILNPAAKVKEGYHAFAFTMKDGTEAIGIPSRETAQEQFIRTIAGEQGLPKANIVSKKLAEGGASLMPAGLTAAWSDRERLNLYAFLMELGRPGPFDASKNNVARSWQLADTGKVDGALKTDPNAVTMPVYTLVDGRLTKDLLAEKLAMLAPKNATVHLTARFQSAAAGRTKFILTGISKAWLDGQPLAIASEPSPSVELTAGAHTFTVEVDAKSPPDVVRVESPAVSFLGD